MSLETPTLPAPATVTADDLAAPLAENMPKATAPTPKTPEAAPPAQSAPESPEVDSLGRAFDPAKFKPERDAVGRWKNLHAGRKGKAARPAAPAQAARPAPSPSYVPPEIAQGETVEDAEDAPQAAPMQASPERFKMLADVYCRAGISVAVGMISDEWAPDNDEEYLALRDAIAAWMQAENMEELSPRSAAAMAILGFAARRISRPKTQGKIARLKVWIFTKWSEFKASRLQASIPA